MIKDSEEWLASIRDVSLDSEPPVRQKNGRWKVADRLKMWTVLGPKIHDDYLDRFQKLAREVLSEYDPQFDLEPEQRFAANLYGKVFKHSLTLRSGMAETLALLGSYPESLTFASSNEAELTARSSVHELLKDADWRLWASLNDVLPLLAEAAPKVFLDAIENALNAEPCPFDGVFAQERSGITGRNYTTGLLWGLETLAWDADLLTSVVILLGELAAMDPGGNWSNRPANSLRAILLPWFPQTCAGVAKRISAVSTLQKELPDVAWKLLLDLLPESHQSSSMTRKPVWRRIIPSGWSEGSTDSDYWQQVTAYANMALTMAKADRAKLVTLVNRLNNLPTDTREQLLLYLESTEFISLPQGERLPIWKQLTTLVTNHRKYAGADWAMKPEDVNKLEGIANLIQPETSSYRHQMLFTDKDFDLYEGKDNFYEQQKRLDERRKEAVNDIYSTAGIKAVLEFAQAVESPWKVGFAFAAICSDTDEPEAIPKLFVTPSTRLAQFVSGFVIGRFQSKGWSWIDSLDMSNWSGDEKATLLGILPFTKDTWERAASLLGSDESKYWNKTHANPYQAQGDLEWAIDRLIENDRVLAAISALETRVYTNEPINPHQVVRALKALLMASEALRRIDPYGVTQLIKRLQRDPNTDQGALLTIEWSFIGLLNESFDASPTLLEKTLARDPLFFCEVIRAVFRPDKAAERQDEPSEKQQGLATGAYNLLKQWKLPPGMQEDGNFDPEALNGWLQRAKKCAAETGHLSVAMEQVGEVLFYSPPDPGGFWIHRAVAEVLDAKNAAELRRGYEFATLSSRGPYFVDPEGKEEREFADRYRKQAEQVELEGYHRLASTLREVAESYYREANQRIKSDIE